MLAVDSKSHINWNVHSVCVLVYILYYFMWCLVPTWNSCSFLACQLCLCHCVDVFVCMCMNVSNKILQIKLAIVHISRTLLSIHRNDKKNLRIQLKIAAAALFFITWALLESANISQELLCSVKKKNIRRQRWRSSFLKVDDVILFFSVRYLPIWFSKRQIYRNMKASVGNITTTAIT